MEPHSAADRHVHQHHGPPHGAAIAALAELLDLDAEVVHAYLADVTGWVRRLAEDIPRHRIVDFGAGTGSGTIALAQLFDGAEVVAIDASEELLTRVRLKAMQLGLTDRIRTVHADLEADWPALGEVDVAWASNVLHEMTDPDRFLKDVFATIRPGGLLAVAEMDGQPRFLPEDLGAGRPGLETRIRDVLTDIQVTSGPQLGLDWSSRLEQAGFALVDLRTFTIELATARPSSIGRYAEAYLRRVRPMLQGRLDRNDLVILDGLLDGDGPDSVLRRDDLVVRGTRTAWVVRRP